MKRFKLNRILAGIFAFLLLSGSVYAQQGTVTGQVKDENGDALAGATVLIEGTTTGALTNEEGKYTFTLDPGTYTLRFSFTGYEKITQEVTLEAGQTEKVNIGMRQEGTTLDDVVIVGYGTQRKRAVTGSISKITAKDLNDIPGTSFEATLQGKAAGVQVIQSSGVAGAGALIRVRGIASVSAGGDPLYVVDGIPITQDPFLNGDRNGQNNNPLASINPNDIESIEILKDAAATGIYGSRGSNGVILITTKRGKKGKPVFDFSTRLGLSQPTRLLDMMTADEWLQIRQEAWENDGNTGRAPLPSGLSYEDIEGVDTDWQDRMTRKGFKQEYNFSMRQGTEKFNSYVGLSFMDASSYLIGNAYERISGRANLDWKPIKGLKASLNLSVARGQNDRVDQAWAGGLGAAQSTLLPIYSDSLANSNFSNPVLKQELVDWRTVEWRTINNLNVYYNPIEGLDINLTANLDYMDLGDNIYEDSLWDQTNRIPRAKEWLTNVTNWSGSGYAQYQFKMPENHNFKAMVGGELQKSRTTSQYTELTNVSRHIYLNPEATANTDTIQTVNPVQEWSFVSAFSRLNYDYKNKLFLQASARVDGSSKFGANRKYGFFPTVGAGYVISEEAFWKEKLPAVNFFKLKASWGKTGNANIPNNARFGLFSSRDNNTLYNGDSTIYPTQLANPDLGWEQTYTFDAGFEIGLFNDRVTSEFTFYNKKTTDILINIATQASTGFDRYWVNVGEVLNRGVEFQVTSRNTVGKFQWTTNFNIAHNYNEVLSVGNTAPDALQGSGDTRVLPGHPLGVNYLVRFSHVDPASGLPVFLDPDGNETMEWSEDNRVVVGDVLPDAVGGINNTFKYKNFELSLFWTYTIGGNLYDDAAKRSYGVVTDWNMRSGLFDRWTTPGQTDATYPRLTMNPNTYGGMGSEWFYNTDQWLYDASYLRWKKLTFAYNFPEKLAGNLGLRSARVYFTATNLLTFTKYPGSDPEIVRDHNGPQGRNISPNVTYLTPPQEQTFSLGLNVQF